MTSQRTHRRPQRGRQPGGEADRLRRRGIAGESGDTLIEVMISALIVAGVVMGTFYGLDSTNRVTAFERTRAEADTLAQAAEDQLRSEPISRVAELEREAHTEAIVENHTRFTLRTTAQYRSATSGSASCSGGAASADYIETATAVSSPALNSSHPVIETAIISPPPETALLVRVLDSAEPLGGIGVTATGPAPSTASHHSSTSASAGCATFPLAPGEYTANAYRAGYVTPNGYENSAEDPTYKSSSTKYLVAEATATDTVELAPAGQLEAKFTSGGAAAEGDTFVASNAAMEGPRSFGTLGAYHAAISTPNSIFPFPASKKYGIYAGTCSYDAPEAVGSAKAVEAQVSPGGSSSVEVPLPPLRVEVFSGTGKSSKGSAVSGAVVRLADTRCSTVRELHTNSEGRLPLAGVPFGTYELCVTGGSSGPAAGRKYTTPVFQNNTATGPSELTAITNDAGQLEGGYAVVYLGSGAPGSPGTLAKGSTCP